MQRGFTSSVILAVVILTVAVVSGVYFYQNTTQEVPSPEMTRISKTTSTPSEFKNYSNSQVGLEFQYSQDLIVKEDSEEEFNKRGKSDFRKNFIEAVGYAPGKVLGAVAVLDKDNSLENNPFSVWVFENPNNLSEDKWFENYWYYPYLWGVFDWTSKGHVTPDSEATISGQTGRVKTVDYQLGKPKYIYISKGEKMYLFRVVGESGEQILSSFKFLDKKQLESTQRQVCGGPVLEPCPTGYRCKTTTVKSGDLQETSGVCIKQ